MKEQQERDNSSLVARLEGQRQEQEQREDRLTGDKEKLWEKIKEEELKVFKQNSRLQQSLSDMGKALEREKAARVEALRVAHHHHLTHDQWCMTNNSWHRTLLKDDT